MRRVIPDALERARDAYARNAWDEAYRHYAEAAAGQLSHDDLRRFAIAAGMVGRKEESSEVYARAYREALARGEVLAAARAAFWAGHVLFFEGGMSRASGWWARGRQLVEAYSDDCVERGYFLIPRSLENFFGGNPGVTEAVTKEVMAIARRFGDADLLAIGGHARGRALIRLGRVAEGMESLDEVMVAVASGETAPAITGDLYCGLLEACREVSDLRRAREWTGALSGWCERQPGLVPYRGPCLVYRAEVLQLAGSWGEAFEEARRACEWLAMPASPEGPADAFYRVAELHRLRGAHDEAEECYRQASRLGRRPEPGLPLLWLARGRADAARAALHRALAEDNGAEPARRVGLLDAVIQVLIALGDTAAAAATAAELESLVARVGSAFLQATASRARGAVLVAAGEAEVALPPLRAAWAGFHRLEAPYEAARVRLLVGTALRDLGDQESAAMEFDAARWVFEQLGAGPDLRQVDALLHPSPAGAHPGPGGLTAREVEVLRLVAGGRTNREIATTLVISEHTVARHVQNMLAKLGFASRTALAAYAVEHGLATT